jgi:hypothetical protein
MLSPTAPSGVILGAEGLASVTLPSGSHTVHANVNDLLRFPESITNNNTRDYTFNVASAPAPTQRLPSVPPTLLKSIMSEPGSTNDPHLYLSVGQHLLPLTLNCYFRPRCCGAFSIHFRQSFIAKMLKQSDAAHLGFHLRKLQS